MRKRLSSLLFFWLPASLAAIASAQADSDVGINDKLNLARIVHSNHNYAEAERLYNESLQQAQSETASKQRTEQMCNALKGLGNLALNQERFAESASYYKRASDLEANNSQCDLATKSATLNNLAVVYGYLNKDNEKELILKQALSLAEKAQNKEYQALILNTLTGLYREQRRLQDADKTIDKALQLASELWSTPNSNTALMKSNKAMIIATQGKYREAEALLKDACAVLEKELGPNNTATMETTRNLGVICLSQGRMDDAIKALTKALDAWSTTHHDTDADTEAIRANLAKAYLENGEIEKAQNLAEKTLVNDEKQYGSNSAGIQNDLVVLGTILNKVGENTRASKLAQRALQLRKNFNVLRLQAQIYSSSGNYNEALNYARQAVNLCEHDPAAAPTQLAKCYDELSVVLKSKGYTEESKIIADKASAIRSRLAKLNSSK